MSTLTSIFGFMAVATLFSKSHLLRNDSSSLKGNYLVYVIFQTILAILWFVQFIMAFTGYIPIALLYLPFIPTSIQWGLLCFIVGGEAFDELVYDNQGASPVVYMEGNFI